ncbi:hypothetical protein D5R81_18170 [Parashewanella spongiae]|uniref:Uncharacterized protein n=1 Tax=Parashewanella spongiae TaxID=342950 RepID=A0A3A6U076_9GAMM|nr:hypothetical protein [Parashewanella spongiae]MCL1079961.1 hypothetical protein [Parashewanella spongiae]RJY06016.1 hypothetical protein D5R81_18170 [Parashewanella spongiae]
MESITKPIAVIIADIVDSTDLTTEQFDTYLIKVKAIQKWISEQSPSCIHNIKRGDEFQSVIYDVHNALKYTLMYRLAIKSLGKEFDCRISFAIASNADIRESLPESMGEAFILSGRGLNTLKNDKMTFTSDCQVLVEIFKLLVKYLDRQITELTSRQCEVMLLMLQSTDISLKQLAANLQTAPSTISKSLKASGWHLVHELIQQFEIKVLATNLEGHGNA